jgi:hypothetical protein
MHQNVENFLKSIELLVEAQPYWPSLKLINHVTNHIKMMTYIQYVIHQACGDLKMNQFALWIIFGGIKLIHFHQNQWEHELTNVASTYMCQLVKGLNITILKWLDLLAQSCPYLTPPTMWCCLVRNVGNLELMMWATNQGVVATTSWCGAWRLVKLVDLSPHNDVDVFWC